MTGNNNGEGARAYRAGKRRIWAITLFQLGMVAAIMAAILIMKQGTGADALPQFGAIAAAVAVALVITFGGWWGFRAVDELEVRYSLTAFTVGFYAHMTGYIAWMLLWAGGLVAVPDAFSIFLGSGLATVVAYAWLKIRN